MGAYNTSRVAESACRNGKPPSPTSPTSTSTFRSLLWLVLCIHLRLCACFRSVNLLCLARSRDHSSGRIQPVAMTVYHSMAYNVQHRHTP